jgi:hypothetical protein
MAHTRLLLLCGILLCVAGVVGFGQENAKEPSTGKTFPVQVTYTYNGAEHTMSLTGMTVRKKFVFKVYGMAHYMEEPVKASEADALKAVLEEGKSKQITMDFARDVDAAKIKDAYADGFKENATSDELKSIQPQVDQFTSYFTDEVKENQQFILRWLPGGVVIASIAGVEKPPITSPAFARVLWSIWFGNNSIVDREDLVNRILPVH